MIEQGDNTRPPPRVPHFFSATARDGPDSRFGAVLERRAPAFLRNPGAAGMAIADYAA